MPTNPGTKAKEFTLVSGGFNYRNREDQTNLPLNIMVTGSQNVLTNVSGRIGVRKGYTLDGQASTVATPVTASYDYLMHTGTTRNLRGGLHTGTKGGLQYRYDDGATVTWRNLLTTSLVGFQFCNYWDDTTKNSLCLFVNGSNSVHEWTGGVTTIQSVTSAGICKTGSTTWAANGFYTTGVHTVVINGIAYGATSGWGTTTLRGINPSPVGNAANGDIAHQAVEIQTTSFVGVTFNTAFSPGIIANLRNQIYLGSSKSNDVYVSKVSDYKNYSFSANRAPSEGQLLTLRGVPTAFVPQEDQMYISAGKDQWYATKFTLSSDLANEAFEINQLKTAPLQAAKEADLVAKSGNNVVFISNETAIETIGRVENIYQTPNITPISNPVYNDIINTDFTDGQVIFHKKFIYISAPKSVKVFVYNMTNPDNPHWEAPQILPVGKFSIIDGELYGHSYSTMETYKLFDGYNDNGSFIDAKAKLAFNSYGMRAVSKGFNQYYVEGYISSNTKLALGLQYDIDGCATETSYDILGTDTRIVCIGTKHNLLGKYELGKQPLGADLDQTTSDALPPKFRVIKTFPKIPFYEYQVSFSSNNVDQRWEVLAFGPAITPTAEGNVAITE